MKTADDGETRAAHQPCEVVGPEDHVTRAFLGTHKAELFPTKVRATGVGLPYAVTVSIFGGTAEPLALWFKSIGHERWFYDYLTALIATSLIVYTTMRDTRRESAMGRHE